MFDYLIYFFIANATTIEEEIKFSNWYTEIRMKTYESWKFNGFYRSFQSDLSDATAHMIEITENHDGSQTIESVILEPTEKLFEDLDTIVGHFQMLTKNDKFVTVQGLTNREKAMQILNRPFEKRDLKQSRINALRLLFNSEKFLIQDVIRRHSKKSEIIECLKNIKEKIWSPIQNPSVEDKHIQIQYILTDIQTKLCDIDSIITIHMLINNSVEGIDIYDFEDNMSHLAKFRYKLLLTAYEIALIVESINMIKQIVNFKPEIQHVYLVLKQFVDQSNFDKEISQCAESLEEQHEGLMVNLNLIYQRFNINRDKQLSFNRPSDYFLKNLKSISGINPPNHVDNHVKSISSSDPPGAKTPEQSVKYKWVSLQ